MGPTGVATQDLEGFSPQSCHQVLVPGGGTLLIKVDKKTPVAGTAHHSRQAAVPLSLCTGAHTLDEGQRDGVRIEAVSVARGFQASTAGAK